MRYDTGELVAKVRENLGAAYKGTNGVMKSNPRLYEACLRIIGRPEYMLAIDIGNALGVPPVKTFLEIYRREERPAADWQFDNNEARFLGAFFSYLFKECLNYIGQRSRIKVGRYGIGTATRYYCLNDDGGESYPVDEFFTPVRE